MADPAVPSTTSTAPGPVAEPVTVVETETQTLVTAPPRNENPTGTGYSYVLLGNWFEERVLRACTGEGRTIPQRHIRRSGLLRDFEKKPTDGYKVTDNTFERCYGHRVYDLEDRTSRGYGQYFVEGNIHHAAQQKAEAPGPRYQLHCEARIPQSNTYMSTLDKIEEEKRKFPVRTTNSEFYNRPALKASKVEPLGSMGSSGSESGVNLKAKRRMVEAAKLREKICTTTERPDVKTEVSYEQDIPISFYTECAKSQDHSVRSIVKVSAPTGAHFFGKNTSFSTPVHSYHGSISHKDYENEIMFNTMKGLPETPGSSSYGMEKAIMGSPSPRNATDSPSRRSGGGSGIKSNGGSSLTDFTQQLLENLQVGCGGAVYFLAQMRLELKKLADNDNFVPVKDYIRMFTCDGKLELPKFQLECFFKDLKIGDMANYNKVLQCIRPSVSSDKVGMINEHCKKLFSSGSTSGPAADAADGASGSNSNSNDLLISKLTTSEEMQSLAQVCGLVTVDDAKTFWYDVAPFVSLEDLKKLLPGLE